MNINKPLNAAEAAVYLNITINALELLRIRRTGPQFIMLPSGPIYKEEDLANYVIENPVVDPLTYVQKV
jgi:hypothetical protein